MQRLNEEIKTGQLKQIYLLYGPENYLRKQYRNRLKQSLLGGDDTMNYHYFEGTSVNPAEIIDLAETLPFFADRRLIVIENSGFFKAGGEKLAEYLPQKPESTCFVFVEAEVDKRCKLFKTVDKLGRCVLMEVQREEQLKRWILGMVKRENKNISGNTLDYLLQKTGTDMDNIIRETEKLFCYCMDRGVITEQDIDAICTQQISNHIFDMVAAIGDKKQRKALDLYFELLALREAPLRILALIARQFNLLLQVKELRAKGLDNKKIGDKIGLPPFVVGKYVAQIGKFSGQELREALEACVQADEDVKLGRMNDNMSLQLLIVRYSGSE